MCGTGGVAFMPGGCGGNSGRMSWSLTKRSPDGVHRRLMRSVPSSVEDMIAVVNGDSE